jgi:tetratricopeptide (TPR) repeat protein
MFGKIMKKFVGLGVFAVVLSTTAMAQTGSIEGSVKIKNPDGTTKPVEGAIVDIFRTDIKGQWDVKTDKGGKFIRLGMPLVGRYLVCASGPGMQPTWVNGVRLTINNIVDIVAAPGDGTRLTLDQIQSQIKQSQSGAPAQPQTASVDKAKVEAMKKEQEEREKQNKELQGAFDTAREHYNAGVEMMKTDNYQGAMSEFEQATALDPTKHKDFVELAYKSRASLAETHYQLGVSLFNNKQRNEAKPHFEKAVDATNQAISIAATSTNPNINNEIIVYYNILAKNAMLLVEYYGAADRVDSTAEAFARASELDSANKNKWGVYRADLFRNSGRTNEAIEAYNAVLAADPKNIDALYGLGLTLVASPDLKIIQEGANRLGEFVANAPPTDRRVANVKEALEAVKNAYKIEAEKPQKRKAKP